MILTTKSMISRYFKYGENSRLNSFVLFKLFYLTACHSYMDSDKASSSLINGSVKNWWSSVRKLSQKIHLMNYQLSVTTDGWWLMKKAVTFYLPYGSLMPCLKAHWKQWLIPARTSNSVEVFTFSPHHCMLIRDCIHVIRGLLIVLLDFVT